MVAPVLSLASVAERWGDNRNSNLHLAREYDALRRYMYLPAVPGERSEDEWIADLSQVQSVSLRIVVASLESRVTQLTFVAAQQLQYKMVMVDTSVVSDRGLYRPPVD